MRKHLYKAVTNNGKGWVKGDLRQINENTAYISSNHHRNYDEKLFTLEPIITETICEFIGFDDCDYNAIFERDILENITNGKIGVVIFFNGSFVFGYNDVDAEFSPICLHEDFMNDNLRVIGNQRDSYIKK